MVSASVRRMLEEKARTDETAALALAYIQKLEAQRCSECHETSCYGCEARR